MKLFPRLFRSEICVCLLAAAFVVILTGCGRHASRPASSLSESDRTTLAKYENIRAALVTDDLRTAKRAAAELGTFLKPKPDSPATPLDPVVKDLADASALDKARTAFQALSTRMVTLADGVEGFYIMESPVPSGAEWVQTMPKADNPYVGRPMRDMGSQRK